MINVLLAAALLVAQASQPASAPRDPLVPMLHCEADSVPCWQRQAFFLYVGWNARGEILELQDNRLALSEEKTAATQRAYDELRSTQEHALAAPYPASSNHWAVPLVVGILVGLPLGAFVTFEIVTHVRR